MMEFLLVSNYSAGLHQWYCSHESESGEWHNGAVFSWAGRIHVSRRLYLCYADQTGFRARYGKFGCLLFAFFRGTGDWSFGSCPDRFFDRNSFSATARRLSGNHYSGIQRDYSCTLESVSVFRKKRIILLELEPFIKIWMRSAWLCRKRCMPVSMPG